MLSHSSSLQSHFKTLMIVVLAIISCALTYPSASIAAQSATGTSIPPCKDAAAPRLIMNEFARVTPGSPDNVRSAPSKSADVITQVSQNEEMLVTGAPTCADGYLWWPVHTTNGFDGWAAEGDKQTYYIVPTTGPVQRYQSTGSLSQPLSVTYDHFQLTYDPKLAATLGAGLSTTTVDQFNGQADSLLQPNPAYDRWGFGPLTVDNLFTWPTLAIYQVSKAEAIDPNGKQAIDAVVAYLKANSDPTAIDTTMPIYPIQTAGQVIHAQNKKLPFSGGSGIRFVAYYAQDVGPITNDRPLRYQFLGLTSDNKYYLFFSASVTTIVLNGNDARFPALNDPNIAQLYPKYLKDTTDKLNSAASTDFSINLDQLDALMKSITVKP